jgi:hypothetical protein
VAVSTSRGASTSSGLAAELRQVWRTPALRRTCVVILALGVLAPLANTSTLTRGASARETANAFTSINAAVLLALLLGVLGTTGSARVSAQPGLPFRRSVGTKARAYGLAGVVAVFFLAALAAAIGLPMIHSRGLVSPASSTVLDYVQREAIAALRLALVGVAIGLVAGSRWRALAGLAIFLFAEAVAEGYSPFIRDYGPIGALNAFSDPSHHHQLPVGTGALIALAWALASLIAATVVAESRAVRASRG